MLDSKVSLSIRTVNFWVLRVGEIKSTDQMKRRKEGGGRDERDEHMPPGS